MKGTGARNEGKGTRNKGETKGTAPLSSGNDEERCRRDMSGHEREMHEK